MSTSQLIAIVGPTAAGKSQAAMQVAQRVGAEIINADAFCLYRGMDIGTAKPSRQDREAVPHHVIDLLDVHETAEVADYQRWAREAIEEVTGRGRPAVLVGGSGLYVSSVLEDMRFPGTDPEVRAGLEARLHEVGAPALHEQLRRIDPQAAAGILPGNGRRIVRALEVNIITGGPFRARLDGLAPWRSAVRIGVDPGVARTDERIAERTRVMWQEGFVDEVRGLADGLRRGRTAARAVGYSQVLELLAGECTEAESQEATVRATRRLSRRQRSWFRRDDSITWVESPGQVDGILGRLVP